jgi:DNA modification methylase
VKYIDTEAIKKAIKKRNLEDFEEDILSQLQEEIELLLQEKLKEKKNKLRIIKNDQSKEHIPVKKLWSEEEIKKLPDWVRQDIDNAYFIGKSKKVIQISSGKKYHIDNRLNDLSGGEWTFFLNSVINTRYPTNGKEGYAHHIRKIHPSPKPPQLTKEIINFFTKKNEWVLDYFMGVGGTLLGASLANRKALGIDLCDKYIHAYKEAAKELNLEIQPTIQGDSIEILKNPHSIQNIVKDEKFSLILIDPPYGDMLSRPKTGEAVKKKKDTSATPFTNLNEDLGNMSWSDFRKIFRESIINSMELLKEKGHIVVFIKDLQPKGKDLNLLHSDLINDLNTIDNLFYLGTKIWADQGVNLYPYGYPYSYVSNQIHQYILIFQKR